MKVVIMESLGISEEELEAFKAPYKALGVEFSEFERTLDKEKLIAEAKDADAMIIANMPMPGDVIAACDKLKNIDVAFIKNLGITDSKMYIN